MPALLNKFSDCFYNFVPNYITETLVYKCIVSNLIKTHIINQFQSR